MHTYFAKPEKTSEADLNKEIKIVSHNNIMSGLLHSISGLLAILDENRQIIAINDSFLKMLDFDDPEKVLGLRAGEALKCVHADEEPGGCGTSRLCSTCGAAIAIVTSLKENRPIERICAISINKKDSLKDVALLVKSHPINIEEKRFLLLFVQDISQQQQLAALERTFFHDINNMLGVLTGASELLMLDEPSQLAENIQKVSSRLIREVAIQRNLSLSKGNSYQPMLHKYTAKEIVEELILLFENHPVANEKTILYPEDIPDVAATTDISLVLRVLCNMILNALEATPRFKKVKLWVRQKEESLSFCVWNEQEIPKDILPRIFQRNFSTKGENGRGIGTFSMKLFGEKILGGKVTLNTSKEDGTVFKLSLPISKIQNKQL